MRLRVEAREKTSRRDGWQLILILVAAVAAPAVWSQSNDPGKELFQIGGIDYFGYEGLNLQEIEKRLPIHVGDSISFDTFDGTKKSIQLSIEQAIGKSATDITAVCCQSGHLMHIYIGLPGKTSRQLPLNPAPHGTAQLDGPGLKLYERDEAALADAVSRGAASEDDSKGYTLSEDAGARGVELEMRAYAVKREKELENVLLQSSDVQQRRASACLLGYADRSAEQIRSLTTATRDVDGEVRNNAIRALSVLASAANTNGIEVEPGPFIALLYSGKWTDRNKSSMLLMHLTQNRDAALLDELRKTAIPPLIEGAEWRDPGHADPFLLILGRIEGMKDASVLKLVGAGDLSQIIEKARSTL